MELLFLSFSVLSSVGLSDIVPIRPEARALVMLESFAGVMYIALVVSRLIGLTVTREHRGGCERACIGTPVSIARGRRQVAVPGR